MSAWVWCGRGWYGVYSREACGCRIRREIWVEVSGWVVGAHGWVGGWVGVGVQAGVCVCRDFMTKSKALTCACTCASGVRIRRCEHTLQHMLTTSGVRVRRFGHALQHMLTTVEEGHASGIRGVEWDAVELPSQFMENWWVDLYCRQKAILRPVLPFLYQSALACWRTACVGLGHGEGALAPTCGWPQLRSSLSLDTFSCLSSMECPRGLHARLCTLAQSTMLSYRPSCAGAMTARRCTGGCCLHALPVQNLGVVQWPALCCMHFPGCLARQFRHTIGP